jgi:hypothetical protein
MFDHTFLRVDQYGSICRICLANIGPAKTEAELRESEVKHVCDPSRLDIDRPQVPVRPDGLP